MGQDLYPYRDTDTMLEQQITNLKIGFLDQMGYKEFDLCFGEAIPIFFFDQKVENLVKVLNVGFSSFFLLPPWKVKSTISLKSLSNCNVVVLCKV